MDVPLYTPLLQNWKWILSSVITWAPFKESRSTSESKQEH